MAATNVPATNVIMEIRLVRELDDRRTLMSYLLGEMPGGEREAFEERYFLDDDLYKSLSAVEDELIESYLRGELARRERLLFKRQYLVNHHRIGKVESVRETLALIDQTSPYKKRGWRGWWDALAERLGGDSIKPLTFAVAVVLLLMAGAVCWLALDRIGLYGRLEQFEAASKRGSEDYPRHQAAQTPSPEPSPRWVLTSPPVPHDLTHKHSPQLPVGVRKPARAELGQSGATRSLQQARATADEGSLAGGLIATYKFPREQVVTLSARDRAPSPLIIGRRTKLVRLRTFVEDNIYEEYQVSLRRAGGPEVLKQTISRGKTDPSDRWLVVDLPAAVFANDDYLFKVTSPTPQGDEVVAFHHLTVVNHNFTKD